MDLIVIQSSLQNVEPEDENSLLPDELSLLCANSHPSLGLYLDHFTLLIKHLRQVCHTVRIPNASENPKQRDKRQQHTKHNREKSDPSQTVKHRHLQ